MAGGLAVGGGLLVLVLVLVLVPVPVLVLVLVLVPVPVLVLVLGGGGVLHDELVNLDLRLEWLVDLDLRVKLLATAASQLAASGRLAVSLLVM